MGTLFQNYALFDSMTVVENTAFPLVENKAMGVTQAQKLATELIESLELGHALKLFPSSLSGGMKKRVGLARAVIRQPKILLYDEPTTGLDPVTTRQVDEMILTARRELGVTSLVISHDIGSSFRIADQVAFLYHGRILVAGSADDVQASDLPELREFLASWRKPV